MPMRTLQYFIKLYQIELINVLDQYLQISTVKYITSTYEFHFIKNIVQFDIIKSNIF